MKKSNQLMQKSGSLLGHAILTVIAFRIAGALVDKAVDLAAKSELDKKAKQSFENLSSKTKSFIGKKEVNNA